MRLVICTPSHGALNTELRDLGIPPAALLRRGIVVLMPQTEDISRIRGLGSFHWCVTPGHMVSNSTRNVLTMASRERRGGELPWQEAIIRMLAWRLFHEN